MVEKQQLTFMVVYFVYLAVNFIAYITLPKLRNLFIATPFDLGARKGMTDAQRASSGKKNLIEFILLAIVLALFYFSAYAQPSGSVTYTLLPPEQDGIVGAVERALLIAFIAHVCFVVIKFIAGMTTSCPKCKTEFARELVREQEEPRSTYDQRTEGSSGGTKGHFVSTWETGVRYSDWRCTVCGHEWQTTGNYKKRISGEVFIPH